MGGDERNDFNRGEREHKNPLTEVTPNGIPSPLANEIRKKRNKRKKSRVIAPIGKLIRFFRLFRQLWFDR